MQDEKVTELFINFGYTGTGLFFAILEKIAFAESPVSENILIFQLKIKGKKLLEIYSFLFKIELLFKQKDKVFNENVLKVAEKYKINKEKNKIRVSEWRENQANNENVTHYEHVRNTDVTLVNKIKENKRKEKEIYKENNKENKEEIKELSPPPIDFDKFLLFFNNQPNLPSVQKLSDTRKKAILSRLKEYGKETLQKVIILANDSDFLTGKISDKDERSFVANFDWILKPNNFLKILEGNYQNKNKNKSIPISGNVASGKAKFR